MLKKRIIPMLLLSNARMVKGKQFSQFRDTGDPVSAARIYNAQNADELFFLDIDANREGSSFEVLEETVKRVAAECFMPLTVGGGIDSVEKIQRLLLAGADKVAITTAAFVDPDLINRAVKLFGRQCIVVGLDVKKVAVIPAQAGTHPQRNIDVQSEMDACMRGDDSMEMHGGHYVLYTHCGTQPSPRTLRDVVIDMTARGAGEFLVHAIEHDGMMQGYDLAVVNEVKRYTDRPLIVAGGAGTFMHLVDAFKEAPVDAVACASLFHFGDNNPIRARSYLLNQGIPMKLTK